VELVDRELSISAFEELFQKNMKNINENIVDRKSCGYLTNFLYDTFDNFITNTLQIKSRNDIMHLQINNSDYEDTTQISIQPLNQQTQSYQSPQELFLQPPTGTYPFEQPTISIIGAELEGDSFLLYEGQPYTLIVYFNIDQPLSIFVSLAYYHPMNTKLPECNKEGNKKCKKILSVGINKSVNGIFYCGDLEKGTVSTTITFHCITDHMDGLVTLIVLLGNELQIKLKQILIKSAKTAQRKADSMKN